MPKKKPTYFALGAIVIIIVIVGLVVIFKAPSSKPSTEAGEYIRNTDGMQYSLPRRWLRFKLPKLTESSTSVQKNKIDLQFVAKASGRNVITDMVVWNNKLYYGTTDHSSCEDVGEVYEYEPGKFPTLIGDFNYFKQQGVGYVRYGNNNVLVPGLDPTSDNDYELLVYDGIWHRHKILPDPGGHLVDSVYFNGKYYVLTSYGFVVVKNPIDYSSEGTRLNFETESYEQKLELGPAQPTSLTAWNNLLYLTGPKQAGCNPKEDPGCELEYFVWKYDGQESIKEYNLIPYDVNFGVSKEFKGSLFIAGTRGSLYRTEDGVNYIPIEFFNDFVPHPEKESKKISNIAVLNDKIYVSVMVGTFNIPGEFKCNDEMMNIGSTMINYYEIYSSTDGISWDKVYSKPIFVKNYPNIIFPIEAFNGKLYIGMTESQEQGKLLNQFINLYAYDPKR